METHNTVKNILKEKMEEIFLNGAFEENAPDDAVFPYLVFDISRVTGGAIERLLLDVRVWDKNKYPDRINDLLDRLEKQIHGMIYKKDGINFRVYQGNMRQAVPDPDKTIKGIRTTYEIHLYGRSL